MVSMTAIAAATAPRLSTAVLLLVPSRSFVVRKEGGIGGGGDLGGGGGGVFDLDLGKFGGDGKGISSFSDMTENAGGGSVTNDDVTGLVSLGGVEGGAARGNGGSIGNTNGAGGEDTFVGSVAVTTVGRNGDDTGGTDRIRFVDDDVTSSFTDLPDEDDPPALFDKEWGSSFF